jgi:hypothetical protein
VTDTGEEVGVPLRAPGMPLFSAKLLAMEECGRRRREGARVGEVVFDEGEVARDVEALGGGLAAASRS